MKNAIIVADDSALIRNIISKKLSDEYIVLQYDGFYVLEYYKQNNMFNKIPVAIISGDDSKSTIDKAFKYPIVDLLNKPLSTENIKNIVDKMKMR